MPVIGVDFDNTLVSYDALFQELALENGLIQFGTPQEKRIVRDTVRTLENGEILWQKLQAEAYGPAMGRAQIIPGVHQFLAYCKKNNISLKVVSHKTRRATQDSTDTDLREAAFTWMTAHNFFDQTTSPLHPSDVFFEPTRQAKIERITELGCSLFIDDLIELFLEPSFPAHVGQILFATETPIDFTNFTTHHWREIISHIDRNI